MTCEIQARWLTYIAMPVSLIGKIWIINIYVTVSRNDNTALLIYMNIENAH